MSDRGDTAGLSRTGAPAPTSALPQNYRPLPFEGYETLNVKSPRAAIADNELAWCDGWMPLAPDNVRTLPDVGPDEYTAPAGLSVVWIGFGNIADQQYGLVLLSDGSAQVFQTATGVVTDLWDAGTIEAPTSILGQTQWGSEYLQFVKDQTNGYWVWDGTNVFTAGTLDPEPEITNAGMYYTSPPSISLFTTGSGHGATATATVLNQSVVKITITDPGEDYGEDDFVIGIFTGGGSDDQARALAYLTPGLGGVTEVIVETPGSGYTPYATVSFAAPGPSDGITAVGYPVIQDGAITSIAIINPGTYYGAPPSVSVSDPGYGSGSSHVSGGSGWTGTAVISTGQITSLKVTNSGSGYTTPPEVVIVGDGSGFVATAQIAANQVVGFVITNYGFGYTKALVLLQGGNNAANATFAVFPWGISGTCIENNQSRSWIANGAAVSNNPPKDRVIYSDPETPTGFGNGGGGFQSEDSFLRVGYHWLRQTNGFLYLGGDSSTNYIGGVSTSATAATATTPAGPPITAFSNQNVDPQIGSPWPASVQVFSRNIVLANPQGIYVSYGGAMTKISTPIDPLYDTCPTLNSPGANFSSAVANIFGVQVYMLLLPVLDSQTGNVGNKLLMWNGKRWFTSQQSKSLSFIASQEYNSTLTAWGTDGTSVFRLFQTPSNKFTKRLQSKFYAGSGYWMTKTLVRVQGVLQGYVADEPMLIALDSGDPQNTAPSPVLNVPTAAGGLWYGEGGAVGIWYGEGGAIGVWNGGNGLNIWGPYPVGQWGRMLGYTITTNASDVALLSLLGETQDYAPNV